MCVSGVAAVGPLAVNVSLGGLRKRRPAMVLRQVVAVQDVGTMPINGMATSHTETQVALLNAFSSLQ